MPGRGRKTELAFAHPHRDCTGKVVLVHNGIVENYLSLKRKLTEEGHKFSTETDTEVIAHLIERYLFKTGNGHRPTLEDAVRRTVKELSVIGPPKSDTH
jgi:glucosamine--fructose-6-phosphate aminotransferase (isomerizing)